MYAITPLEMHSCIAPYAISFFPQQFSSTTVTRLGLYLFQLDFFEVLYMSQKLDNHQNDSTAFIINYKPMNLLFDESVCLIWKDSRQKGAKATLSPSTFDRVLPCDTTPSVGCQVCLLPASSE